MNEIQMYDAAKEQFRNHYSKSYPMPTRTAIPDLPTMQAFWRSPLVWVTIFIAIAAAFMSALRTFHVLDTVDSKAGAIAGIIVIEGMAGLISFFLVLREYKDSGKTKSGIRGFMLILTYGAIALGLLTNVYSIMLHQHKIFTNIEWAVVIMAGSIAVFAIAILMHILGIEYVSIQARFDKAMLAYEKAINYTEDRYKEDLQAWADEFEAQWKKPTNQRRYMGMVNTSYQQQVSAIGTQQFQSPMSMAVSSNASIAHRGMGFAPVSSQVSTDRQTPFSNSPQAQIVYEAFQTNTELIGMSLREIAEITGVNKDTVSKVKQYISNQADTNNT